MRLDETEKYFINAFERDDFYVPCLHGQHAHRRNVCANGLEAIDLDSRPEEKFGIAKKYILLIGSFICEKKIEKSD